MEKIYGLVSVTFRDKTKEHIAQLCVKAGLDAIEWGGDIHVPHGDIESAKQARALTEANGLITTCYGSYFRLLRDSVSDFESIVQTAVALNAPKIRVWCGNVCAEQCSCDDRKRLFSDCKSILETANEYGVGVHFECHRDSFTQTKEGASELFGHFRALGLLGHWQPNPNISFEENIEYIDSLPSVCSAHVFEWEEKAGVPRIMHPLSHGYDVWKAYVTALEGKALNGRLELMLEFVNEGSEESFFLDASTLKTL